MKGKIDVLVALEKLWILVIEAKSTQYDVFTALPQAIAYMISAPNHATATTPSYSLLVNGREFVFVKLVQQPEAHYAKSIALSIDRGDDLAHVLKALKNIKEAVLS